MHLPSQNDTKISELQLKSSVNAIAKKYTNIYATCEILTSKEKLMLGGKNIESRKDRDVFDNMSKDERIIYFRGGEGLEKKTEPIQIYAIFECWLFVQEKTLPYDIIAVAWPYTSGGMDNTNDQMTIITKGEFEEIFNESSVFNLSPEQAAHILADKWIIKTGYVKK